MTKFETVRRCLRGDGHDGVGIELPLIHGRMRIFIIFRGRLNGVSFVVPFFDECQNE